MRPEECIGEEGMVCRVYVSGRMLSVEVDGSVFSVVLASVDVEVEAAEDELVGDEVSEEVAEPVNGIGFPILLAPLRCILDLSFTSYPPS